MRIAYTTLYDATTTDSGFGSYNTMAYHLARALGRAGASVDMIGPLKETFGPLYWAKQAYHQKFTGKTYNRHREILPVRDFSRQIAQRIHGLALDCVFSPISPGSQPIAYLDCDVPIVVCSDSPLASAVKNYPALSWDAAVPSNLRAGLENERAALTRASLILYPSQWAADAACAEYGIDRNKVKVIPWGANLETTRTIDQVRSMIERRDDHTLRLLFVGLDWKRKGGQMVLETLRSLEQQGIPVHLDIIGCDPFADGSAKPKCVTVHGRLMRNDPEQSLKFDRLFSAAHFLFMPSKGEAFGHVFAEASSFGVPSIATDVDGIPAAVRPTKNGRLFPSGTTAAEYADAIARMWMDREAYRELAVSSFREFSGSLNWDTAATAMLHAINGLRTLRPTFYSPKAA